MKIERYHVRDTFAFFRHCAEERFEHPWLIVSETCANCGITYAAHFEHPERCPGFYRALQGTGPR
jgi:hypothetical protein